MTLYDLQLRESDLRLRVLEAQLRMVEIELQEREIAAALAQENIEHLKCVRWLNEIKLKDLDWSLYPDSTRYVIVGQN